MSRKPLKSEVGGTGGSKSAGGTGCLPPPTGSGPQASRPGPNFQPESGPGELSLGRTIWGDRPQVS